MDAQNQCRTVLGASQSPRSTPHITNRPDWSSSFHHLKHCLKNDAVLDVIWKMEELDEVLKIDLDNIASAGLNTYKPLWTLAQNLALLLLLFLPSAVLIIVPMKVLLEVVVERDFVRQR
jgi:hypothetical protein